MNQADGDVSTPATPHFTFSILHAAAQIEEKLESALGSVGLSMAKHSALSKLAEAGEPLTLSDLAERLSCVRSNITQLVDRLEADGLVRRVDDPADRRSVRAELTPLGIEKQAIGASEISRVQSEISERISASDLGQLESALSSLS
jgi:DNA-binding MarR family transcriptional regulator